MASGLTQAEVAERVARGQLNTAPPGSDRTFAQILRANVLTRFNALIGFLAVLVLIFGSPIDALFGLVIVFNSAVGVVQELRAKRTLDRLSVIGRALVRVRRDGTIAEIPPEQLVLDDIILIGPGEKVPVDAVVVDSGGLEIDESLLTGESDPVVKDAGDEVLSGSFGVAGSGEIRAAKVGADSYAATLVGEASRFSLATSELQQGINRFLSLLTWVIVPVGLLLIIRQLTSDESFADAVVGSVAGIVPMIPEGLVLMTSIAFALGVIRLGRRQCLVQELPAVETLARVDTLCVDKTGTLTEPGMTLRELKPSDARVCHILAALIATDDRPNATLQAIAPHVGAAPDWTVTDMLPFSSARKYSGAAFAGQGAYLLGAFDVLLPPADPLLPEASSLAAAGLRVLALASASTLDGPDRTGLALVVLDQSLRPTAEQTLRYFADQDVSVKVISGDNAVSVGAVAARLGVVDAASPVDARTLTSDSLPAAVDEHSVFGRVTPQQKKAMVKALRSSGHTVAMTGDGVNDVLALKDADLGIAMGSGSGATRAVAKVVLLDNDFATLPSVLAEGRRVLANIERVANLFLTKTVYSVLLALLIGLAGLPFPFLPRHVTIVASLTIGIPAFFLAFAPSAERTQPGFVPRVLRFALPAGIACALATFLSFALARGNEASDLDADRSTATLTLFLVAYFALVLVARPLTAAKAALLAAVAVAFGLMTLIPQAQLAYTNVRNDVIAVAIALAACGTLHLGLRWDRWRASAR